MTDEETPTVTDPLSPKEEEMVAEVNRLRQRNAKLVHTLETNFGGNVEMEHARLDHLIDSLTNLGVITREQNFAIRLSWEQNLRRILMNLREQMLNAAQQQAKKNLALPIRPEGIILPNGRVHRGSPRPDHKG